MCVCWIVFDVSLLCLGFALPNGWHIQVKDESLGEMTRKGALCCIAFPQARKQWQGKS